MQNSKSTRANHLRQRASLTAGRMANTRMITTELMSSQAVVLEKIFESVKI